MSRNSRVFCSGDKIGDTLLTIVGPVSSNSWRQLIAECTCGKEVVLSYQQAYMATRYSCGCKRRPRSNRVDYTNLTVHNRGGNRNAGRTLHILGEDTETQQWQYLCECCAEIFSVPRGLETGLARAMRDIAGQVCPNYRTYYTTDKIHVLVSILSRMGYRLPNVALKLERIKMLSQYYEPDHVKTDAYGWPMGLYGLPDKPLPKSWMPHLLAEQEQRERAEHAERTESVIEQFDEFGET